MKKMRLVSSILAGSMLISALPLQTLAYFQSDENGRITKAGDLIRGRTFEAFMPLIAVAIIYLLTVIILTAVFGSVERRLRKSER